MRAAESKREEKLYVEALYCDVIGAVYDDLSKYCKVGRKEGGVSVMLGIFH